MALLGAELGLCSGSVPIEGLLFIFYCVFLLQIFDSEPRDEDTEVCFVDIAYDEIPERYYKESEVGEQTKKDTCTQPVKIRLLMWDQFPAE